MVSDVNTWLHSLPPLMIYLIILVLTAIIYKTAFAVRLPVLKSVLVYVCLALGCGLLTLFHYMNFPMIPALAVTVILIAVTRLRLYMVRKQNERVKPEKVD
ncbi:MAG: YlaH-like family protein [Thermoactinomyces sp.]